MIRKVLSALGPLILAAANLGFAWGWAPPDRASADAYRFCGHTFRPGQSNAPGVDDGTARALVTACKYGAYYAHQAVYEPYYARHSTADYPIAPPARVADFRRDYEAGRDRCEAGYDADTRLRERMACLDGYAAFAANVAVRAGYLTSNAEQVVIDDQYLGTHTYLNAFEDMPNDVTWVRVLQDRILRRGYLPKVRLDQLFPPPAPVNTLRPAYEASGGSYPSQNATPTPAPSPSPSVWNWLYHPYANGGCRFFCPSRGSSPSSTPPPTSRAWSWRAPGRSSAPAPTPPRPKFSDGGGLKGRATGTFHGSGLGGSSWSTPTRGSFGSSFRGSASRPARKK